MRNQTKKVKLCGSLWTGVNLKSYCTHFLPCPVQLSSLDFTALFRPLYRVSLSLPGLYEPKWRGIGYMRGIIIISTSRPQRNSTLTYLEGRLLKRYQISLAARIPEYLVNTDKMSRFVW